jgi:hypothetical protein
VKRTLVIGVAFLIVAAASIAATVPAVVNAGTSGRFVLADSGTFAGVPWEVGMARIHRQRCYSLSTARSRFSGEGRVCGGGPPMGDWGNVLGDAGERSEPSFELDLTSPRVRSLNLLLGHPGTDRTASWHRFQTLVLNGRQARISHMPRDFRFAVIAAYGPTCVEAVEAVDFSGQVVMDEEVPCEY